MTDKPTQKQLKELWSHVKGFIDEQEISCVEAIGQCDRVILNAYDFIEGCCDVVGYWEDEE